MPFTTAAFLEALSLPEEHPYLLNDGSDGKELRPWSFVDYFGSASSNGAKATVDDCPSILSPFWRDQETAGCEATSAGLGDYNNKVINIDKVSFFEEIKPCISSMCHMVVLLWAPIILFLCAKRLTTPHRHRNSQSKVESDSKRLNQSVTCFKVGMSPSIMRKNLLANVSSSVEDQYNKLPSTKLCKPFTIHQSSTMSIESCSSCTGTGDPLAYIVALLISAIIMTDAMYILEFSRSALVVVHAMFILMGMKRLGSKPALLIALPFTCMAFYSMRNQDLDLPTTRPGIYYSKTNSIISNAINNYWPMESYTYEGKGTPWMITGDVRTGLPFLLYSPQGVQYTRRWVPLPDEQEAVILDIAFPESDIIEDGKNVYLLLHGINGNSNEGYVLDFARQLISEGNIVAVMVTRGLMNSPVVGRNLLHFARTSDVAAAAKALKAAITKLKDDASIHSTDSPMLAGVGYSMGAITLANYVASAGKYCALDVAVGFSGALDTREQATFHRSELLWQPFIAKAMRDTMVGKFMKQIESKFSRDQFNDMMRARSLVDLDRTFFAPYNDYKDLDDYYSNTGAMGDFESFDGNQGRIANTAIPLLMVQSLDDPVGTWRTFHNPKRVVETGNGNVIILFTQKGGHVGWPVGVNPKSHGWSWMNNVASSFVHAIGQSQKNVSQLEYEK